MYDLFPKYLKKNYATSYRKNVHFDEIVNRVIQTGFSLDIVFPGIVVSVENIPSTVNKLRIYTSIKAYVTLTSI